MKESGLENHKSKLPERWVWCRLGEICSKPQYGWTASARQEYNKVKILRTSDVSSGTIDWNNVPFPDRLPEEIDKYKLSPGDILIARAGSVGVSIEVEGNLPNAVFGSYLIRFRTLEPIASRFVSLYLRSLDYWDFITEKTAGITTPNVNASKLKQFSVPLPPLPEQRLIIFRVEALLERVKKAKEYLDKVPRIIKQFRQAVLKKAFSGELTAEWREKNPNLEPATELLKSIQEERKRQYEEATKAKLEGKRLPKKPKNLESKPLDTSNLPEGWVRCRLGQIVDINKENRNPTRETPTEEFTYVDITGIEGGTGIIKEVKKIRGENASSRARRVIHTRDVIMSTVRPYLRAFAIIPPEYNNYICSTGFAVLTCNENILPKYLLHTLFSDMVIDQCNRMMVGTHYPALNKAHVYQIQIPLPPILEQKEIVRRVEALFKFADGAEKRVEQAKEQVEKITQSVLSRAFKGELTEDFRMAVKNWKILNLADRGKYLLTLPEDEQNKALHSDKFLLEPASVLLERIREIQPRAEKMGNRKDREETKQIELWRK
jgi:type I restriction enzyme S subunit